MAQLAEAAAAVVDPPPEVLDEPVEDVLVEVEVLDDDSLEEEADAPAVAGVLEASLPRLSVR